MNDPLIAVPDTVLARRAHDLVQTSCEPHLVAHSLRSFHFAALVARSEQIELDWEVLYIGTVLHDVGLADRFVARGDCGRTCSRLRAS